MTVGAELADAAARDAVVARLDDPAFARSVQSRTLRLAQQERAIADVVTNAVLGKPADEPIDGLWTDSSTINRDAWRQLRKLLEEKATAPGSELTRQALLARQLVLRGEGERLRDSWPDMVSDDRRAVIGAVVDHFVVSPAKAPRNRFKCERLRPVWHS